MLLTCLALAVQLESPPLESPPPPPPLPDPAGSSRKVVRERGNLYYYRPRPGFQQRIRVGGRLGFGVAGRLAGPLPVRAAFALDVIGVARVPVSRGDVAFGLLPELGYSLTAGAQHTLGNFVTAGMGLGVLSGPLAVGVIPRLVAGRFDRERALGVRTGLLVEGSKEGGFSLELAHQALFTPRGVIHELRATISITIVLPL